MSQTSIFNSFYFVIALISAFMLTLQFSCLNTKLNEQLLICFFELFDVLFSILKQLHFLLFYLLNLHFEGIAIKS